MGGRSAPGGPGLIHFRPSNHPPRHGPFAALGPIVRDQTPELEDWGGDRRLRKAFPSVSLPSDHPLAPYLEFEQNDSSVLGCVRERGAFTLIINHYNAWRLAAVLADDADCWHRLRDRFPVCLRFEGVREFRVVQQRLVGEYRVLRTSLDGLASALWDVISLRCVGAEPNALRFALDIHGWRRIRSPEMVANEITILFECEKATVVESLRERWIEAVGPETLPLMEEILAMRGLQRWGVDDFERFVAEGATGTGGCIVPPSPVFR